MKINELVALSDALLDESGAAEKPAVLIAQYDVTRDQHVCRWSCADRTVGFRPASWPVPQGELGEVIRAWRAAEEAPGSTMDTAEKAKSLGSESRVIWANLRQT